MKKKVTGIMMLVCLLCGIFDGGLQAAGVVSAADDIRYTVGTEVSGEVFYLGDSMTTDTVTYVMNISQTGDYLFTFTDVGRTGVEYTLTGSTGYQYGAVEDSDTLQEKMYLAAGQYTLKFGGGYGAAGKFRFSMVRVMSVSLKLEAKKGTSDGTGSTSVSFTYNCTDDYAANNLKVKTSSKKVATVSIGSLSNGVGSIELNPGNALGKTTITVSLAGAEKAQYVFSVTKGIEYVALGSKIKLTKPVGITTVKWKSKKTAVAETTKKGAVTGISDGKARIIMKKNGVTYRYRIIVTDYINLGQKGYKNIEENVRDPDSLKLYNVYYGLDKNIIEGKSVPVVFIDYGATNAYGAMDRDKNIFYYNEVHELNAVSVTSYSDISKCEVMNPDAIIN